MCVRACVSLCMFIAVFIRVFFFYWDLQLPGWLVWLWSITNQPMAPVTTEFSVTDEPSWVGVSVRCVDEGRGFGVGQASWDHSPVTDHSLSSAVISHLRANGKRVRKRRNREEWGKGGEKTLLDSEEEAWDRVMRGGSRWGHGWENEKSCWDDEEEMDKKWTKTKILVSE